MKKSHAAAPETTQPSVFLAFHLNRHFCSGVASHPLPYLLIANMVLKKSLSATLGVLASFYAALLIIQARLLSWSDSLPTGNDVLHAALQRPDSKDRIRRRVGIVGTSESREQYRQISGNFPRVAYMEAESKFDAAFWTQRREHPVVYENTDNQGRPPPKQHQTPVDPPIDQSMCEYISEWQYTPRPTCNHIHEISLADGLLSKKAHVLGNGGWRVGLEYELPYDKIVFKTTIQRKRFDELTIHRHFVDAAVTDEMTHSSHSVRQYGYCSQAALNEFAPHTLRGYMKAKKKSGVVVPSSTKLNFLSQVAQGLVDLHYHPSHPDKVAAVYNDLKPSNIVLDFVDEVPLLKLSDFNDVKIVKWNTTSDSECHFRKLIWDKNVSATKLDNERVRLIEELPTPPGTHLFSSPYSPSHVVLSRVPLAEFVPRRNLANTAHLGC
jgi:serine/threonine protein kinase